MAITLAADVRYDVAIEDVAYQHQEGRALLARLYRPSGAGPFPAALQLHGGAWVNKDRTDNDYIAKALAQSGVLVAAIDFRLPPQAPYPAALADINLATRWLKARVRHYGGRPDRVGIFGTSSGGHLALLTAMRPEDPRYRALALAEAPEVDATVAFTISGWGVLDPVLRYDLAKRAGNRDLVRSHDAFWGSEAAMSDGSPPAILARGERVHLPPALIFQGDADEWVPTETARGLAEAWRRAGGVAELVLYPGAKHGFMTGKPDAPYAGKAVAAMREFIRKHAE
ncbi:MAG TPA: alpha/beta hydrolase [Stellaceae bacterium]|nr:alpha/beta hydrolase [Stellaceae bacterium]